ncbi:MAG TPA: glycosyltransferase [Gemmatimonadales bacterium]|jgi:hypothetical protein
MRVLVLGAGGDRRTEMSIVRAVRSLDHHCRFIDVVGWCRRLGPLGPPLVRRLGEAFRPDSIILTRHARRLGEDIIREMAAGRGGGFWYFDLSVPPLAEVVRLARAVGRIFVTCHSQMAAYRSAGVPEVLYLPQGVDSFVDRPAADAPERLRCDFSFVGSGQYVDRHELLRRIAAVGRLQIRGPGWSEAPADLPVAGGVVSASAFPRVVRGAAISLGAHATRAQDSQVACISNRMWKVLGCRGFFLGPWQTGLDRFARDGEHCAWYRGIDEAAELGSRYLADSRLRDDIAAAGREHALAAHTYAHRVELLLAGKGYEIENAVHAQTIL